MKDDHDLSVAIDLSRRKAPTLPPPRAIVERARRGAEPYVTMTRIALGQLGRDRLARTGALVLACLALVAVLADVAASDLPVVCRWRGATYVLPNVTRPAVLAGLDVATMRRDAREGDWLLATPVPFGATEPSAEPERLLAPLAPGHPLGTDTLGRDVFARLVHGARTALVNGLSASLALVAIGLVAGAAAGFLGGTVDALVARAVEALAAIPSLVLVLVVLATVPHAGTATLLWTIALTRWTDLARLVRAEVLAALGSDYVTAARALGAPPSRVLWRHVLPNVVAPALVAAAFGVASVVLLEAAVDFLHVGAPDTAPSWGEAMGEAREHPEAWWLVAFPGAALLVCLVALNLLGDAARDALDPRLRGRVGELGG